MTHNQSELEQLLDYLYEKGYNSGDGMSKYPKDVAILETQAKIERYITANYTPTSEVEEQERLARIDELYAVGNTFFPSGVSDGSSNGDWLEQRISELKKENGNG